MLSLGTPINQLWHFDGILMGSCSQADWEAKKLFVNTVRAQTPAPQGMALPSMFQQSSWWYEVILEHQWNILFPLSNMFQPSKMFQDVPRCSKMFQDPQFSSSKLFPSGRSFSSQVGSFRQSQDQPQHVWVPTQLGAASSCQTRGAERICDGWLRWGFFVIVIYCSCIVILYWNVLDLFNLICLMSLL